jgi:hypothetical protein
MRRRSASVGDVPRCRYISGTGQPSPEDRGLALDHQQPALHLLAGLWVASCPTCGFQLATATSQARCEQRSRRRPCPVCHQEA